MKRFILLFFLEILGSAGSYAQLNSAFLDQLSVEDGLSQSEVSCVLKDRRGYVWLGTQNGLNRFDGYRFVPYKHDPFNARTLSNDHILSLHEDAAGRLWVGTVYGLNAYDPTTDCFTRYESVLDPKKKLKSLVVHTIADDSDGTLWLGTSRGTRRFFVGNQADVPTLTAADSGRYRLDGQVVWTLHRDKQQRLWAGTQQGLFRLDAGGRTPIGPLGRLMGQSVSTLTEDADGRLWLAADSGLFRLDAARNVLTPAAGTPGLPSQGITALLTDRHRVLWVGTQDQGICRFRIQPDGSLRALDCIRENYFSKQGLKSSFVTCLHEGPAPGEDVVWIGTKDAGVHRYSRSKNSFRHWESITATGKSAAANLIFSLCTDRQGQLWAGTYQGVFRIDRATGRFRQYRHDPTQRRSLGSDRVQALLEDRRGRLWVGTDAGLFRFEAATDSFEPVPLGEHEGEPYVLRLYEDRAGNLWVGTGYGLYKIEPDGRQRSFPYNPKDPTALQAYIVSSIQEDADNHLWIGTAIGLNKIDRTTGQITRFVNDPKNPASLVGNEVYDLVLDAQQRLWVCSNKGLSRVVKAGGREAFVHVGPRDGLPNDVVYGALPDARGRLWVSTNFGLSCFDPERKTFRNYDAADGLSSNEFNMGAFHRSRDGQFFFGGIGTLVSFDPLRMTENQHVPNVVLSSFQKFEKRANVDSLLARNGRLVLGPGDNFFSFTFTALDYTNPSKNQYAYQLEGFDEEWIYSGTRRYASFTNIPPGEYVLNVKASNSDGVWNERTVLRVPLTVKPPFWRMGWFLAAVVLVLGIAARLFYNYRVHRRVAHLLELEKVKLAENERVRKLAAQDLHDEFGNTITRISMLTELIKSRLNGNGQEVVPLLTKISDNSNRMYQGTKDFIWAINPEHDNFHEIAIRLKDFGDDVFDKTGIRFEVEGLTEELKRAVLPMGASRHLVFLFKEAMSNTLKHAHPTRTVLRFGLDGNQIWVEWQDNGVGFEASGTSRGNGLQNMESRARKIGGTVWVSSDKSDGTRVRFGMQIPGKDVPQSG